MERLAPRRLAAGCSMRVQPQSAARRTGSVSRPSETGALGTDFGMETIPLGDLEPLMRLDESLHLECGTLVLHRGQAVDEILLEALASSGVSRLVLCSNDAEAEELASSCGLGPAVLDDLPIQTPFWRGLYEPHGRKLLSAGRSLTLHRKEALAASGVELAFEPPDDLPARVARAKRRLARRRAPRARASGGSPPPARPRSAAARPARAADSPPVAEAMLARAVLASEAEALVGEMSLSLSLDVPRALEAARSAAELAFKWSFAAVAVALGAVASGRLRDHVTASAVVACACARELGLGEGDCLELATAALLHDAAMAWVREDLLAERGPLSEAGVAAVRRHPLRAFAALADADGLSVLPALAALEVHERSDGTGYPLGLLAGDSLGEAKLLAVVDVLCALLAPRPHRPGLAPREAMDLCIRLAGEGSLDGECIRALLRAVGLWPVGSAVRLSTGELARVVATSGDLYERPVVSILREASGEPPASRRLVDLSAAEGVAIAGPAEAPWEGEGGF